VTATASLPGRFTERAAALAPGFRRRGLWRSEPVDLIADAARAHPDRPALVTREDELDYRGLADAVSTAAGALREQGVGSGDPVLLVVGNDVHSVIAIHATLHIGAIALLVSDSSGDAFVSDVTAQTSPCLVLRERELAALRSEGASAVEADPRSPDAPAMVIFTSGTTSRPKGVVHSMNTMLVASRNYVDAAELTADEAFFLVSPLASVTGVLQAVTVPPLIGARAILEDRWEPAATCSFLLRSRGSFYGGPDLLLGRLLDEAERTGVAELPIDAVFVGGAMLDRRILDRAERDFGIVVMRAYGSSEAPISTAGRRREPLELRLGDDGAALAGVELKVGSSADASECCVRGAHLFLGYVADEDDRSAFEDGWFRTGDLADLDGERLRIFGRIKDIVIRNGLKIPISEVEGLASALPGVVQAAGYGVDDEVTGERLALAVRPQPGAAIAFDEVVDGLAAAGIARWKLPEELVVWDEPFPETATGKVVRNQLGARAVGRPREVAQRLR
jgi:acyl-CoA synthetase (AMP-forming)/AMP-acid ligase II